MTRKIIPTDMNSTVANSTAIYPDPVQKNKGAAISSRLTDIALAGDMPASRLFSNLPAAVARDVWQEVLRERQEIFGNSPEE